MDMTTSSSMIAVVSMLTGNVAEACTIIAERPHFYKAINVPGAVSQSSRIVVLFVADKQVYRPMTPLGKKLIALRNQAIAKGLQLLNADEIVEELRHRRGEMF
jgi:hypothetical protein